MESLRQEETFKIMKFNCKPSFITVTPKLYYPAPDPDASIVITNYCSDFSKDSTTMFKANHT